MKMILNSNKTAVILAGGLGSRLRPYTLTIPKPLLPLNGIPIIHIVIRQLASCGFTRVIISLGYMSEMVKFVIDDGSKWGVQIEYLVEDEPLGTAGSLFLIKDPPPSFLVLNGDLLTTFQFDDLVAALNEDDNAVAAVALHRRDVRIDYGVVKIDSNKNIVGYEEKPVLEYQVSMGIYALKNTVLRFLDGTYKDMPTLLLELIQAGHSVIAFETESYWQDIGRLDDFNQAEKDFESDPKKFLLET